MDQSSVTHGYSTSFKLGIGFGIICLILIVVMIFCCFKTKGKKDNKISNNDRRSSSNSIESFQQLFFTKTSHDQPKSIEQTIIERWSSINQPSLTFYRVYVQDTLDDYYQPVTEQRLRASIEQSKAMEYTGLEIIFF